MKIDRRKFFRRSGIGLAAGAAVLTLDHHACMGREVTARGEVLCDLQAHPANYWDLEDTVDVLLSPGLVGLGHNNATTRNLTYEGVLGDPELRKYVDQITLGQLAMFSDGERYGFFCRAQEVQTRYFDILALGFEGEYFAYGREDSHVDVTKAIHDRGGIAIVVHPFVIGRMPITDAHRRLLYGWMESSEAPDAVEVHNAQLILHLRDSNIEALTLAEHYQKPGIAASDAHRRIEQVKMCGIGVPEGVILDRGMPGLVDAVRSGGFVRYGDPHEGPFVSLYSSVMGQVYEQVFGGK